MLAKSDTAGKDCEALLWEGAGREFRTGCKQESREPNMNEFMQKGYLYVPGLIDTSAYYTFFGKLCEMGKGNPDDKQVPGSKSFYGMPLFEKLLEHLQPKIEAHTGVALFKTYSYARRYEIGNELKPHVDRKACEITATLALGFEGEIWPIWVEDREKVHHSFLLQPGDALIFRGMELKHWREENRFGPCSQVFLHYVDKNGPHACCKDDAGPKRLETTRDCTELPGD